MLHILVAFDWIETGSASKDKMSAFLSLNVRHNWHIVLLMIMAMAMARAIGQKSIYKTIDWPACLSYYSPVPAVGRQTNSANDRRKTATERKERPRVHPARDKSI